MKKILDFRRLMKVVKYDLKELAGSRWTTFIIIAGVFLLIDTARLFVFGEEPITGARVQGIYFFLCFLMLYVPTLVYGDVKDAEKGIFYPLLPASSLEKFLSMMMCCVILLPFSFLVLLTLCDSVLLIVRSGSIDLPLELVREVFGWENIKGLGFYIGVQSVFIAGNLHFPRNAFIKSLLLTLIAFIIYAVIKMIAFNQEQLIQKNDDTPETLIIWIITLALWFYSYFRLKRLEYA